METQEINKIKILYIITKSNWGGAQKYVYDLATNIPKDQFEPMVAHGGNGDLISCLKKDNIKTIEIPNLEKRISLTKEIRSFVFLIKLILREKPEIIHLNSSKIGGLGSLAGRIAGVPKIIFTAHGWAFNEENGSISKILIKIASWFTVLFSHTIITLSEFEKNQTPLIFGIRKVVKIYLGIDDIDFKDKRTSRDFLIQKEPKLAKKLNTGWIGSIGELTKNKGYEYALEAMKEINDVTYVIIGNGEDDIKNKIIKNDLEEKVFNIDIRKDASSYIKAFDIFLLPSIKEGLPYVLIEARQAKIPIVSTKVGGVYEIINGVPSIMIEPKDKKAIVKAIESVNIKDAKWPKFSFGINSMVNKTIEVYLN